MYTLIILLISISIFSQNIDSSFVGEYTDGIGDVTITDLILRENGTFYLKTPDPLFSYTFQTFTNEGSWISRNDTVILNPELFQRITNTSLTEKHANLSDSILIKIRYLVDYYQSDTLLNSEEKEFELLTFFVNNKRKYFNLVRYPHRKMCAFAPKVKNQVVVDSTNAFKIKRKDLDKIGIFTYGFDDIVWMKVSNKKSNHLEIEIIQQVDIERTPRNRQLIVKRNKVYFYKRKGKIDKSLLPLIRNRS